MQPAMPCGHADAPLPPTIVVTGGKGGVGTTTVALNLAVAMTHLGRRTALVDAAPQADAAQLAGVDTLRGWCLNDLLDGLCTATDALRPGPAGTLLVAGRWASSSSQERSSPAVDRLLWHLSTMEVDVDVLIIDSGSGSTPWSRRLWQRANLVLVVTTPADVAMLDAYATLKRGAGADVTADIHVLVNQCDGAAAAKDVERRIATACRRFLGRTVQRTPRLLRHVAALDSDDWRAPRAWEMPDSPFGRSVQQLGRFAADVLARHRTRDAVATLLRRITFDGQPGNQSQMRPDSLPAPGQLPTCSKEFSPC